jgi:hypothetical protein
VHEFHAIRKGKIKTKPFYGWCIWYFHGGRWRREKYMPTVERQFGKACVIVIQWSIGVYCTTKPKKKKKKKKCCTVRPWKSERRSQTPEPDTRLNFLFVCYVMLFSLGLSLKLLLPLSLIHSLHFFFLFCRDTTGDSLADFEMHSRKPPPPPINLPDKC